MMGRVQDKVALVTGGASGVGREDVLLLAEQDARVVLSGINEEAGLALARETGDQAMFVRHDVSSQEGWAVMKAVQERFGALHCRKSASGEPNCLSGAGIRADNAVLGMGL